MAHRPCPKRQRALRQIERHEFEVGPAASPRPLTEFGQQLLDGTHGHHRESRRAGDGHPAAAHAARRRVPHVDSLTYSAGSFSVCRTARFTACSIS